MHIYSGDGKGKTSAAVGLALRAAGDDKRVLLAQFLKGRPSGEIAMLEQLPRITVLHGTTSDKFPWEMTEEEKASARSNDDMLLEEARKEAASGAYDLLVLDEALDACNIGLLDEGALLSLICNRPEKLELVLTGSGPSEELLATADYVTEMHKVRHPFDRGVEARRGIEY